MWMFLCFSGENGSNADPGCVTNGDTTFNDFDTEPNPTPMFCLASGSSEIIPIRQQRAKGEVSTEV